MKKLRKASSITLCLTLFATLLAACGSTNEEGSATSTIEGVKKEGFPIVDKTLTLKVMSQDAGVADWSTMPVLQEMEKLSGIKLEYQLSPIDSFETKKIWYLPAGTCRICSMLRTSSQPSR